MSRPRTTPSTSLLSPRRMTKKQAHALGLMIRAREEAPDTDDGLCYGGATFYDTEIHVAYVNWRTAEALVSHGLVKWDRMDDEWSLRLANV